MGWDKCEGWDGMDWMDMKDGMRWDECEGWDGMGWT